ncbi:MAG: transposase [Kiritimatiellae bacterium]|nr:transposase [Kiritimatiellia bacterium]
MSASNKRVKVPMTYHHLMSRIAHKVFFMKNEERDSFIEMMRRVAEFTGLKLLAWCIMENHFHILAYLPERVEIDDLELRRRYRILKGMELGTVSKEEIDRLKKQMYSVGGFMKILKQWFTQEYNARYQHTGTLWEGVYKDVLVKEEPIELAKRAAYIHLNPIKAAITTDFTGYLWSSFNALKRGDEVALAGMRMIYENMSVEKILSEHSELMEKCLDGIKKERASKIADMRAAGLAAPVDHLTSEAMVAQEIAHREEVAKAIVEEKSIRKAAGRPSSKEGLKQRIRQLLAENPSMSRAAICEATGASRSSVYRCIGEL